jgi:hypothetical protein
MQKAWINSHAPPLERVGLPRLTVALLQIVSAEAYLILLDLFATADNTLVPRFFARYPEPLAEGADALAQLD